MYGIEVSYQQKIVTNPSQASQVESGKTTIERSVHKTHYSDLHYRCVLLKYSFLLA